MVFSYPDGSTRYTLKEKILQGLKEVEDKAFFYSSFFANYFKTNPKKFQNLLTSNEQVNLNLNELIQTTTNLKNSLL